MKHRMFCLVLALLMLLQVTAVAEVRSQVTFNEAQSSMTVSVTGLESGREYFLLVTRSAENTSQALAQRVYMCVVTASASGEINHAIISSDLTGGLKLLLGGVFEDGVSPRVLGEELTPKAFFPAGISEIAEESFLGAGFTSVQVGSHITRIGDRAFKDCANLRTVYIDNDNVVFGEDVFAGCRGVILVCSENSTAAAYAQRYSNVTCLFK